MPAAPQRGEGAGSRELNNFPVCLNCFLRKLFNHSWFYSTSQLKTFLCKPTSKTQTSNRQWCQGIVFGQNSSITFSLKVCVSKGVLWQGKARRPLPVGQGDGSGSLSGNRLWALPEGWARRCQLNTGKEGHGDIARDRPLAHSP